MRSFLTPGKKEKVTPQRYLCPFPLAREKLSSLAPKPKENGTLIPSQFVLKGSRENYTYIFDYKRKWDKVEYDEQFKMSQSNVPSMLIQVYSFM